MSTPDYVPTTGVVKLYGLLLQGWVEMDYLELL